MTKEEMKNIKKVYVYNRLNREITECDESFKGWVLMAVNGISTGWGKASGGRIKNHYPKGLRIQ